MNDRKMGLPRVKEFSRVVRAKVLKSNQKESVTDY